MNPRDRIVPPDPGARRRALVTPPRFRTVAPSPIPGRSGAAARTATAPISIAVAIGLALLAAPASLAPAVAGETATGSQTAPAASGAAAAIAAEHAKIDAELRGALISPFTAVQATYVEAGRTIRIGADDTAARLDPEATMPFMAAVSYADGAFTIAPIAGAKPPAIRALDDRAEPVPGPGAPLVSARRLGEKEVVAVGRFLLDMSPQSGMGRVLVYDPESPMKRAFTGLKWFAPDPTLQVKAVFRPEAKPAPVTVGTSRGLKKEFWRAGTFAFAVDGVAQTLVAFAGSETLEKGDDLFIPFRDATTGKESYEVGRYLHVAYESPDATYVLDFNKAGNPNCNYSPHYNCPIPPKENTLTVAIRAGERTYPSGH